MFVFCEWSLVETRHKLDCSAVHNVSCLYVQCMEKDHMQTYFITLCLMEICERFDLVKYVPFHTLNNHVSFILFIRFYGRGNSKVNTLHFK